MNTLAIIIPYYKIDFFEETLKSVAAQNNKDFVLYIGNDASPDTPIPLIKKYCKDTQYHYYNYKDNLGGINLAMQWERILKNVKEEWFQILGDDDMISDNFVQEFYSNLPEISKNRCNVVKFSQRWIDQDGKEMTEPTDYPTFISPIENYINKFVRGHRSSLSEYIFRNSSYKKHYFKKFPLAWGTDDYAVLQFSEKNNIYFADNGLISVRISDKSISGSNENIDEKALALYQFYGQILSEYITFLPKDYIMKRVKYQIDYAYHNKVKLNINLFKTYLCLGEYKKLLKTPVTLYYLYFN